MRRGYVGLTAIGGAAAAYILLARPRQLRWGAIDQESDEPLPGDDLIPSPNLAATRAITVRASAERVWPWIAQLGQGDRGSTGAPSSAQADCSERAVRALARRPGHPRGDCGQTAGASVRRLTPPRANLWRRACGGLTICAPKSGDPPVTKS
jgi:hypothetical protein